MYLKKDLARNIAEALLERDMLDVQNYGGEEAVLEEAASAIFELIMDYTVVLGIPLEQK